MAKQDFFFRYMLIIRKLRSAGKATFQEIADFIKEEREWEDYEVEISSRTFQRDVKEIRNLFRIDISYDFSDKTWFIGEDDYSGMNNRLLESLDTLHSLGRAHDMGKYIYFEKRQAQGTHHLSGLIKAIRKRTILELEHQKFVDEVATRRLIAPYALKESLGRWYIVAKDLGDKKIKVFGLDRILSFTQTHRIFDYPPGFDVNEHFRYCFGIIKPDDQQPENIILSFDAEQGKYIRSYPLHESQAIIAESPEELRISLYLYITYDLVQEILSYGNKVRVLVPAGLTERVLNGQ